MGVTVDLTKPEDVARLFVATAQTLREMGAVRVDAFGLSAWFERPRDATSDAPVERHEQPSEEQQLSKLNLSEDEKDMARRLRALIRGGSAP